MQDLIIIGAGPIGLTCGIEAQKANLNYHIIEKGVLVNSLYNYPANMTFFSTSDKLEIGNVPFISHNPKPTRSEALEYYRRVTENWNLKITFYSKVNSIIKNDEFYEVKTNKATYQTKAIIISTGFYDIPNRLNIPGEDLPKVLHYYKDAHPFYGQKIAIIGAANSAVDVALETYRKGAGEVTMIVWKDQIRPSVKYWVKPDIENRLKEGSIKSYFNAQVTEIGEKHLTLQTPQGTKTIENDFVLAMTGYRPDFQFLQKAGITLGTDKHQTPTHNPETYETNQPNIYLAGVICGGLKTNTWFIENSRIHATKIIQNILK